MAGVLVKGPIAATGVAGLSPQGNRLQSDGPAVYSTAPSSCVPPHSPSSWNCARSSSKSVFCGNRYNSNPAGIGCGSGLRKRIDQSSGGGCHVSHAFGVCDKVQCDKQSTASRNALRSKEVAALGGRQYPAAAQEKVPLVVQKANVNAFSHARGMARRGRPFDERSAYAVATGGINDLSDLKEGQVYDDEPGPVVVIDNYDSFTYNLCQYLGDLGCKFVVHRNDDITVGELKELNPSGIVISPGPGTPDDSGISLQTVLELGPTIPMFGVCMGLQCMGQAFGGKIVRAPNGVMHGKTSQVFHAQSKEESGLLVSMPSPFMAARYHSLVIDKDTFPVNELEITAWTSDGLVMGVRHKKYRHMEGVQFHPESIITSNGMKIVKNFLHNVERFVACRARCICE